MLTAGHGGVCSLVAMMAAFNAWTGEQVWIDVIGSLCYYHADFPVGTGIMDYIDADKNDGNTIVYLGEEPDASYSEIHC